MKILVINSGSSTIKYQVYGEYGEQVLARGIVARIGEKGSYLEHKASGKEVRQEIPVRSHHDAFDLIIQSLLHPVHGGLTDIREISAVGHRTVHGADTFVASTLITPEVVEKLEQCVPLAPLHNPPNLIGIREAQRLLPSVPHVAVFDTAFHQTIPEKAYLYAVPWPLHTEHRIRAYGFHGTSCRYVSGRAAQLLGKPLQALKMVICHLGNGVTIAAVDGGKSIDTSIGFATFSGVMMGTRSGDIDPGLIFYLHREAGFSIDRIESILYKESGLLGVSGVSNDMRVIQDQAKAGNERCQLAMEMFAYRTRKYIGAYAAALEGLHALVFTAGIGENSPTIRQMICKGFGFLGMELDDSTNSQTFARETIISKPGSRVSILVVPTDEEKMIVLDTIAVAGLNRKY